VDPVHRLSAEAAQPQSGGRFDAAAACCQQAIETAPHMAPALLLFERLRLQPGRHAEAADLIGRSLGIDPAIPAVARRWGSR